MSATAQDQVISRRGTVWMLMVGCLTSAPTEQISEIV